MCLTVTVVFAGCTGPRGLRQLDGTLVITAEPSVGGAVVVTAHADDLAIGEATLALDATARYQTRGATSSLEVHTTSSGVGPLGAALTHAGDYTVTWDASCVAVDGAWSSETSASTAPGSRPGPARPASAARARCAAAGSRRGPC